MIKFSTMRLWALAAMIALSGLSASYAQMMYDVNGGAGSTQAFQNQPNPFYEFWWTNREQYIIRASDIQAVGMPGGQIVSVAFLTDAGQPHPQRALRIHIKQTTANAFVTNAFDLTGLTQVVNIPAFQPTSSAWNTFTFSSPFLWDGTSNLLVDVCTYRGGWTSVYPNVWGTTTNPSYNTTAFAFTDGTDYCVTPPTFANLTNRRPVMRFGVLSGITQSFPDDVDPRRILRAGDVYDGSSANFPKPSLTFRQSAGQALSMTYRIVGPLPSTNVIYIATENGNANDTIININATTSGEVTYVFSSAKGSAAGANGALDLREVPGGVYRVEASYAFPGYSQQWMKEFNIAFSNDLAVRDIILPNQNNRPNAKYPRGTSVPVVASFQNVGLNNVTAFQATAVIRNANRVVVYTDVVNYSGSLATGDRVTLNFANFATLSTGIYSLEICGNLQSAQDQQLSNNCLPSSGVYTFEVQHDVEIEAVDIPQPNASSVLYANRPVRPQGRFRNIGISDQSDIPAQMIIERLSPNPAVVYNQSVIIPDISVGNIAQFGFPIFTPPTGGSYRVCIISQSEDDPIRSNDTVCNFFNVNDALSGTYTIGTQNMGSGRNFATLQDAANALYGAGVAGPVIFEFTDANYTAGNATSNDPALDLRSTIIGVNATNTITFRPSQSRSTTRSSVNINLRSGSGLGIALGESYAPTNPNSVFPETKSHFYANATGY
ncbi:MAG TPA: hypothetical protein VEC36_09660, partial [Patescibacteria group bacterium]|nr:hypothetical protein [Patescibacteria group bacterium]